MAQAYYGTKISDHISETPEGFLICHSAPLARTATTVPQRYRGSEIGLRGANLVDVYRASDEVFSEKFLASLEGKPVTDEHPHQFINAKNGTWLVKGHIQNVQPGPRLPDGEHSVVGDLVITDAGLIEKIRSGVRELSVGYQCKYTDNGDGSFSQTNLRANHVAVVASGRAGEHVRIYDAEDEPRGFDEISEELHEKYNPESEEEDEIETDEEEETEMAKSDWEDLKREIKRIVAEEMRGFMARQERQREEVIDEHPLVGQLRKQRARIQASGDRDAIDAYNSLMRVAKTLPATSSHLISAVDSRRATQSNNPNEFFAAAQRFGAKLRGESEPTREEILANEAIDGIENHVDHFDAVVRRARAKARREDPLDEKPSPNRRELGS